ncbi:MAG: hypothetical protein WCG81_07870, partial [Candidatus Angelobacter sp.]
LTLATDLQNGIEPIATGLLPPPLGYYQAVLLGFSPRFQLDKSRDSCEAFVDTSAWIVIDEKCRRIGKSRTRTRTSAHRRHNYSIQIEVIWAKAGAAYQQEQERSDIT